MIYPKITLELPDGDDRIINQWWIESKDGGYHVCISVDDPINAMQDTKLNHFDDSQRFPKVWIDAPKHKELWHIDRTLVESAISCLESGLENTQSALLEHDRDLGRTTTKNRMWAETLEREIKDTKECIRQLKTLGISHTTYYP